LGYRPRTVQANRAQGLPEFTGLAERLAPVVVNVSSRAKAKREQAPTAPFGENDPLSEFWRRFFGSSPGAGPNGSLQEHLGSGFIVDRSGIVLTNNHVIEAPTRSQSS